MTPLHAAPITCFCCPLQPTRAIPRTARLAFPVAAAPTTLAAADFFTTEIWTPAGLVTFYVFFAIQLKTRRVHISIRYCQIELVTDRMGQ